jgi:hypothetical protein
MEVLVRQKLNEKYKSKVDTNKEKGNSSDLIGNTLNL